MRVFAVLVRLRARLSFDPVDLAGPHHVCDRNLPALLSSVPDLAIGEDHVVKTRVGERGFWHPVRKSEKFPLHLAARRVNGAADRGGSERSALDWRIWQCGIAKLCRHAL